MSRQVLSCSLLYLLAFLASSFQRGSSFCLSPEDCTKFDEQDLDDYLSTLNLEDVPTVKMLTGGFACPLTALPFGALKSDWARLLLLQRAQPEGSILREKLGRLFRILAVAYYRMEERFDATSETVRTKDRWIDNGTTVIGSGDETKKCNGTESNTVNPISTRGEDPKIAKEESIFTSTDDTFSTTLSTSHLGSEVSPSSAKNQVDGEEAETTESFATLSSTNVETEVTATLFNRLLNDTFEAESSKTNLSLDDRTPSEKESTRTNDATEETESKEVSASPRGDSSGVENLTERNKVHGSSKSTREESTSKKIVINDDGTNGFATIDNYDTVTFSRMKDEGEETTVESSKSFQDATFKIPSSVYPSTSFDESRSTATNSPDCSLQLPETSATSADSTTTGSFRIFEFAASSSIDESRTATKSSLERTTTSIEDEAFEKKTASPRSESPGSSPTSRLPASSAFDDRRTTAKVSSEYPPRSSRPDTPTTSIAEETFGEQTEETSEPTSPSERSTSIDEMKTSPRISDEKKTTESRKKATDGAFSFSTYFEKQIENVTEKTTGIFSPDDEIEFTPTRCCGRPDTVSVKSNDSPSKISDAESTTRGKDERKNTDVPVLTPVEKDRNSKDSIQRNSTSAPLFRNKLKKLAISKKPPAANEFWKHLVVFRKPASTTVSSFEATRVANGEANGSSTDRSESRKRGTSNTDIEKNFKWFYGLHRESKDRVSNEASKERAIRIECGGKVRRGKFSV